MSRIRIGDLVKRHPLVVDALLAVSLLLTAQVELWAGAPASPITVVASMVITGPLAIRRRSPLLVAIVVLVTFLVHMLLTGEPPPAMGNGPNSIALGTAWLIAIYSVAAYGRVWRAVVGLVIAVTTGLLLSFTDRSASGEELLLALLFSVAVPWLAGALRARQMSARQLAELANELRHERDRDRREAVAEERSRLSRELHDIVAHHVSLVVVQAQAGQSYMAKDPKRAREAFQSIEQAGRQALAELRRLLGILRKTDAALTLAPQPGLAYLGTLLEQVEKAGLSVELKIEGEPQPLPAGVDLSAYRVIQEALTNTLKHAGGARAQVAIRYERDVLELEIMDDGRGVLDGDGGHGLLGMEERVSLFGGELQTGPRPEGGYALRARFPFESVPS